MFNSSATKLHPFQFSFVLTGVMFVKFVIEYIYTCC